MLMRSWGRRKQHEAKLLALEVGKVIAQMFGGSDDTPQRPAKGRGRGRARPKSRAGSNDLPQGEKVSPSKFLNYVGVKWG